MLLKGIAPLDISSRRKSPVSIEHMDTYALRSSQSVVASLSGLRFDVLDEAALQPRLARAVWLRLVGSVTNQGGAPTSRLLSRSGHPHLCPVFGGLIVLKARRSFPADIPATVYMKRNGQPACISTADVAEAIKRAAAKPGQVPRGFSAYSLHSDGATHMYRAGPDAPTI
ncbi:hypothetical protein PHMEG_00018306 [Phytophthora megakarya]|uniref:Uncharacterized protein n=1 Tax=Phytophthora megakarya TaxID=4795 RepID=A0A225VVN5_9STRA|nr:hypothetical protein PHMEG_00018306 [Phytophthora megakarya]